MCCIRDEGYIPQLLAVCEREQIDALIPTIDTDLVLLAQNKARFAAIGTRVVISDETTVRICADKRLTAAFFESCGLKTPPSVDDVTQYTAGFPAFIKPRDGSSSINAYRVNTAEELVFLAGRVNEYIIQPFVDGDEYTVDLFCDFEGNLIYVTPRARLAVRSGEVLRTRVEHDATVEREMQQLVQRCKPCGAITVQFIRNRQTGENHYIEINPRYGGGSPLSIKAGADSAEAMLRLLSGETVAFQPRAARDGAAYSRFDQSVCVNETALPAQAVVFDLDDTLYSERDYMRSGFRAVAALLPELPDAEARLWAAWETGKPAIDAVLAESGIDESRKDACVVAYRTHTPDIRLYDGVPVLFDELRRRGLKIGILTDGRPEGQRAKLAALGLEPLVDAVVITDELGGAEFRKPCDIPFRVMQRKLGVPFEAMVYVGDNPNKDFIAPRQLGMRSVWLDNAEGLYTAPCDLPRITEPKGVTAWL